MKLTTLRTAQLRSGLEAAVAALHHRRASEIADGDLEDYVSLGWIEWNGGTARLTEAGKQLCRQDAIQATETASTGSSLDVNP